jgi:amidase
VPSSCCGVFGLKPTRGRNPLGPDNGDTWRGFVCEHVITRSVRDSAAMLDATAGPDTGAPYYAVPPSRSYLSELERKPDKLRIAFTAEPFFARNVEEDCVKGLEETVKLCRELGHEVVEAAPEIDRQAASGAFITVVCSETSASIKEASQGLNRKASYKYFEPVTWMMKLLGDKFSGADFSQAINLLQLYARQVGEFFEQYDILLTPTLAMPPLKRGASDIQGIQAVMMKVLGRLNAGGLIKNFVDIDMLSEESFRFAPYTPLFNTTGQPAMSAPLYWNDEGLPIGMQFVGRYGDEATLFRLAGQLEEARPWADRVPPVCAGTQD